LLIVLLVSQSLRVAFSSPRLRLQHVEVTGTQRLASEDITRLGSIPMGANIFRVNLVQVSERLRKDPVIREAVVTRELPGTVIVDVRERKPGYQVTSNGAVYHADAAGVVYERAKATNPALPRLEVTASDLPELGKPLRPELFRTLRDCVRLARLEQLPVTKIRVDAAGELWLNVTANAPSGGAPATLSVRVGRATELAAKFRDIHRALAAWPDLTAKALYLDVMCAGRPAYLRADASDSSSTPTP
jgi:hypothetical protein